MPPVAGGLVQTGSMAEDASEILVLTSEIAASYLGGASHVKGRGDPRSHSVHPLGAERRRCGSAGRGARRDRP